MSEFTSLDALLLRHGISPDDLDKKVCAKFQEKKALARNERVVTEKKSVETEPKNATVQISSPPVTSSVASPVASPAVEQSASDKSNTPSSKESATHFAWRPSTFGEYFNSELSDQVLISDSLDKKYEDALFNVFKVQFRSQYFNEEHSVFLEHFQLSLPLPDQKAELLSTKAAYNRFALLRSWADQEQAIQFAYQLFNSYYYKDAGRSFFPLKDEALNVSELERIAQTILSGASNFSSKTRSWYETAVTLHYLYDYVDDKDDNTSCLSHVADVIKDSTQPVLLDSVQFSVLLTTILCLRDPREMTPEFFKGLAMNEETTQLLDQVLNDLFAHISKRTLTKENTVIHHNSRKRK